LIKLINRKIIYTCLLLFILTGCREPYFPEIDKYENLLVIDGLITDREGPHLVRITRSYSFDESYPESEQFAVVAILDEDGGMENLTEERPGHYYTSAGYRGEIGKAYQLVVSTSDNEQYESEWVILSRVPEIDSVTHRFVERATTDPHESHYGMEVRVNTHDETNQTRYYRWEWTETWEIITPIKSSFYPDEERCWRSNRSSLIAIGTSEHLTDDVIEDHPLYFISTENNRLRIKYSALISQYSMSREAYSYWKSLQEITQNTGTLFDPTPAAVTGNIYHSMDQEKPVLGIFQASAVSEQRIFIDRDELPNFLDIPSGYAACEFFATADSAEKAYYLDHHYYLVDIYMDGDLEYYLFCNAEYCYRCTLSGTNIQPDYWPDN